MVSPILNPKAEASDSSDDKERKIRKFEAKGGRGDGPWGVARAVI